MDQALSSMPTVPTTRNSSDLMPFVLDARQLSRVHEVLVEFGESVGYAIDCADGQTRQLSLADLQAYDNDLKRAIRSLQISTRASADRYARMRLRDNDLENVEVDFAGPEGKVLELSDAVDTILANATPWYSWMAKYRIWQLGSLLAMVAILLVTVLGGGVALLIRMGKLPPPDVVTVNDLAIGLLLTSGFAMTYVTFLALLEWFRISLFPVGTFAIGLGKRRYRLLECVRWIVVLSLLAGVIGGVLALLARVVYLS